MYLKLVRIFGLLTLFFFVLMFIQAGMPKPKPNARFQSVILDFELVRSKSEAYSLLGDYREKEGQETRQILDKTNLYDFPFIISYSAYTMAILLFLRSRISGGQNIFLQNKIILYLGAVLSLLMCTGDILENIQLLKITEAVTAEAIFDSSIKNLIIWTNIKWISIFLSCILISVFYYFEKSKFRIPLTVLYLACGILGLITFIEPSRLAEPVSGLISLCWTGTLVQSFSAR
ncbi:MAG TPA: hypothetical protein PL048_03580 [Leptospiraceae bacterium]|nr:hypothetical protein [Leptospiraceae bacterium]HNF23809.1 hypothetical protein [Leptospiraceae bacterium]HNI95549.1 hypothetical protein [Leptospiraceae bacterium]